MTKQNLIYTALLVFAAAASSPRAHANTSSTRRDMSAELAASTAAYEYEETHYTSWVRVALMGGATLDPANKVQPAHVAELSAELGRGLFTLEVGAESLGLAQPVSLRDSGTAPNHLVSVNSEYVGVPLILKCNYIERHDASFAVKAGAMPAFLQNNRDPISDGSGTSLPVTLNPRELFVVAGFTGSAPLSASASFMIDGSYLYGTRDVDSNGTHSQGVAVTAGVRMSL